MVNVLEATKSFLLAILKTLKLIGDIFYEFLIAFYNTFIPSYFRVKDIGGQTVLITGAGSGIGRLLAVRFAKLGCRLVLWDIDAAGLDTTARECREHGVTVSNFVVDLAKREAVYAMADRVKSDVGDVDILVNNAGIVIGQNYLDCPDYLIEKTMLVNCHAHFWTVKSFLPGMIERNHGHLVNVASAAGIIGVNKLADYCASKFAAVGFDEALRFELFSRNITGVHTTVVCPFYINTGMFDGVQTESPLSLPIVEPDYAADKIMTAIRTNQYILCLPRMIYVTLALKGLLPVKMAYKVCAYYGVNKTMEHFRGRQKSD